MRLISVSMYMVIALALAACGKKGPLVYPEMLVPAAPSNLIVRQSGSSMKISFDLPSRDLAGRSLATASGIRIMKRDAPSAQDPGCSSCTADFTQFRKLNLDLLQSGTQRYGNSLVLMDDDVTVGRAYTYRVSALTRDNLEGAVTASGNVDMKSVHLPPVAQVFSRPTEVQLEFVGLPPSEGVIAGYNVYRTLKGEAFSYIPQNNEPVAGNRFVDTGLERGTSYVYRVRIVARMPNGTMVESSPSNEVEGILKDDE